MRAAFVVLLLSLIGCQRGLQGALDVLPAEGSVLPSFSFEQLDGSRVTAADLRGQPTVLALWSSTCGKSRMALAGIAALHGEYASRGVRVLVLANDASARAVQSVVDSAGVTVPMALAAGEITRVFAPSERWPWQGGVALPSFLVLDRDGVVRHRVIGIEADPARRMERVRQALASLLPEAGA